jgi:hypothetical protein
MSQLANPIVVLYEGATLILEKTNGVWTLRHEK